MIQILINNVQIEFGRYPHQDIIINTLEIRTSPLQFGIQIERGQGQLVADYLWNLVNMLCENSVIIFNGVLMNKNDVSKFTGYNY